MSVVRGAEVIHFKKGADEAIGYGYGSDKMLFSVTVTSLNNSYNTIT